MPRHHRRAAGPEPTASGSRSVGEQLVTWRNEEYVARSVTGSAKMYRCPGCDQEIKLGQSHVVAWPAFDADAEDRRHWHHACWDARDRRAPRVQRSRTAPRY
jgi:hypothetical protein